MKKVYLLLVATSICGLIACGGEKKEEAAASTEAAATEAPAAEAAPADTAAATATTEAAPAEAAPAEAPADAPAAQ